MITILDGGLGSELGRRGLDTQTVLWSTVALLGDRGRAILREVHRDYVFAGADVITANTFRTNRRALDKGGIADRFAALVEAAVHAARTARDEAKRPDVRVAGSMAPLEDCYRPDLRPPPEEARREHGEHAKALAGAGCDLLLVETVGTVGEGLVAAEAALETGLPVWFAAMAHPRGEPFGWSDLREVSRRVAALGVQAVLLNCTPVEGIDAALPALPGAGLPFGAYAHMGEIDPASGWPSGPVLSPGDYRARACAWIAAGATIVGGCCGTTPNHIAALASLRSPAG